MAQFNLNRLWIFETYEDEAPALLHPGDAVGLDGRQTRVIVPEADVLAAQVARVD